MGLWIIGHHLYEVLLRAFGVNKCIPALGEDGVADSDSYQEGESSYPWGRVSKLCASVMGSWESVASFVGMFLMVWASVFQAKEVADHPDNADFTSTELDIWGAFAPIAIWAPWQIQKFFGYNHHAENTGQRLGIALHASFQAVGWVTWGWIGSLQRDRTAREFCIIAGGVNAILESVVNHTSLKTEPKQNYPRMAAIGGYIACCVLFVIGFVEKP